MSKSSVTRGPVRATWVCLSLAWAFFLIPIPGLGIGVGWPLNFVAFIIAIVVMSKGNTMGGLIPLLLSLIASPVIYMVGLGLFSLFVTQGLVALDSSGALSP